MRGSRHILAPILVATLTGVASAQIERARQAVTQVDVIDDAFHRAMKLLKKKIPAEEKEAELKKLVIRQEFRLLVSGVAVGPTEIVTRALHPRARLRVMVTFRNGKRVKAQVVGNDPLSNVALLRTRETAPGYLEPSESPVAVKQETILVGYWGERLLDTSGILTRASIGATCEDIYSTKEPKPRFSIGSVFVVASTGRRLNPGSACIDRGGRVDLAPRVRIHDASRRSRGTQHPSAGPRRG